MSRGEPSFNDASSFGRPSLASVFQTPLKEKRPATAPLQKPETFNVSHLDDSYDRARLGGLTHSLRTVHPDRRHSGSIMPTPGPPETPLKRVSNVTLDPRGVPAFGANEEKRPSLPPPLPVSTPVHAIPRNAARSTLIKECLIEEEEPVDLFVSHWEEDRRVEGEVDKTPPPKKKPCTRPDSPDTCATIHSGTIAGNLIKRFLQDDIDTRIVKDHTSSAIKSSRKPSHH